MLYQELESYSKISQQTQGQERLEIGRRILENIQRIKGKDHKSTHTHFTQKERKI